jgi:DNA-binding transcriptional LysR family regulator
LGGWQSWGAGKKRDLEGDAQAGPFNLEEWSGYHRRSLVETKMGCFKRLGERVMARDFQRQVVADNHPLSRRKRVRMVELHRLPMVLLPASFVTRQMLDECFRSCGAKPPVVAEINTLAPIMGLVAKTQLAAIVSPNAVQPNSGLATVRLESRTPVRTPGMLW